ncbi:MAG: ribonuclease HI family protein [Candidatus Saccharibacteria bacterium]|nr:ribonuclease HI family protein [Candidatus Saccharibacteria bacterium]
MSLGSYKFKKEFTNRQTAWDFINYLSQKLSSVEIKDLKIYFKDHQVELETQTGGRLLIPIIEAYFNQDFSIDSAKLFCDGGSRGNPGPGACGFILLDKNDRVLDSGGTFYKYCTNNQAEYQGLLQGVKLALNKQIESLQIFMDSQLIVKQIQGQYKVRNPDLSLIYQEVVDYLAQLQTYSITFIPRKYNQKADAIVNQILDQNL